MPTPNALKQRRFRARQRALRQSLAEVASVFQRDEVLEIEPIYDGEKLRGYNISFSLTDAHWDILRANAKQHGVDLQEYVRRAANLAVKAAQEKR